MNTKKQGLSKNEERGRQDGAGWRRRNRVGEPEEKVIWNHFRMSEDMGKVFNHVTGYDQYRRGFMFAVSEQGRPRRRQQDSRMEQ